MLDTIAALYYFSRIPRYEVGTSVSEQFLNNYCEMWCGNGVYVVTMRQAFRCKPEYPPVASTVSTWRRRLAKDLRLDSKQ